MVFLSWRVVAVFFDTFFQILNNIVIIWAIFMIFDMLYFFIQDDLECVLDRYENMAKSVSN